jgi:tRNA threonylcarbamoyladenosine biosynthesis protein TsaB
MRVLAFDTATARTAVALRDFDDAANVCLRAVVDLAAADDPPASARPGHAQHLLALIQGLLEQSNAGWEAVDRIAVGVGPGTFTGMRIGIATAQALAAATATPLVGVSTLRSLESAASASLNAPRAVLAVIDARRGEAFAGGNGLAPCVLTPDQLTEAVAERSGRGLITVGDGALKFRELLERAGAHVPPDEAAVHRVSAREHCRLALEQTPSADGRVEPQYLRLPDAEVARA